MDTELVDWAERVFARGGAPDCKPDAANLQRLAEIFENCAALLATIPDKDVSQAFWDLSESALMGLRDEAIPWTVRQRLINSFQPLFVDLFAAHCEPVLGHLSEGETLLGGVCYMWWDFDCWVAAREPRARNPLDAAFLKSMESILAIDHAACQESALHGLGHWHRAHPEETARMTDDFLARNPTLRPELRTYAEQARCACVL